jgi:nucleotide-binding universal stress UspA family protein
LRTTTADNWETDMLKTLLVATDGSEQADKAVILAADLAQKYGAMIVLLHIMPDVINGAVPKGIRSYAELERMDLGDAMWSVGEEILHVSKERAHKQGAQAVETVMDKGSPAQEILKYANEHDVDLIVMGCRGLGHLAGAFLGSVSNKVSHLASQTCITVR